MPVVEGVLFAVAQWVLATIAGWVVLGWFPPDTRRRWAPAAPLIGLAALIVTFSLAGAVLPMRIAAPITLLAVAAGAIARLVDGDRPTLRLAGELLVPLVLPLPALLLLLVPLVRTDSALVMTGPNHDAMFYVATADWAADHPYTESPGVGFTPATSEVAPTYFPAHHTAETRLRVGDALLSSVGYALGLGPVRSYWMLQMLGWLAFVPAALAGAAACLDRRVWFRAAVTVVGTVVMTGSSVLAYQVFNQNAASVLGIVLFPMAAAAVWSWLDDVDTRPPALLTAVVVAALLGSYSEYTSILGVAFAVIIIARAPRHILPAAARGLRIAALTVAVGPVIVWRVVHSLLFLSGVTSEGFGTLYRHVELPLVFARALGTTWPSATMASPVATALVASAVTIGLVSAVILHRSRRLWLGLTAGAVTTTWYVTVVIGSDYSNQRSVEIMQPIMLWAAVVGWTAVADRAAATAAPAPPPVAGPARTATLRTATLRTVAPLGAGLLVATGVWAAVALSGAYATRRAMPPLAFLERRAVDPGYDDLTAWADRYGGPAGVDLTVVTSGVEESFWAGDALRHFADVDYPILYPGYQGSPSFTEAPPDGISDRYLLVDRQSFVIPADADALEQNERFLLFDTASQPLTVLSPRRFEMGVSEGFGPGRWVWLSDDGDLVAARSRNAPRRFELLLSTAAWMAPLGLRVAVAGGTTQTFELDLDPITATFELPEQAVTLIRMDTERPGVPPPDGSDARGIAVRIQPLGAHPVP
ncbi:MAG: hypothetical protein ACK5PP_01675 [Acidimicrobiales bacterium]